MTDNFESISKEIANDFLQSIIFIDDKAYSDIDESDVRHEFDAQAITKEFAKDKKICAVYQPKSEEDIEVFSLIAQKADVTVLDWQIIFNESLPDNGLDTEDSSSDEDDDDDDDIRGKYTKRIINNLLTSKSSRNSLKLIIVYTGDSNLSDISLDINKELIVNGIKGFKISDDDSCCVFSDSCKILVRSKSNGGNSRSKYNAALIDKEIKYEELPTFITAEFSKLTNGLLSNFALLSLTAIRQNFYQILNIFSKKLDAAYLTHQSLLPNTDDANELLVELLGDTFTSILRANNLNSNLDDKVIRLWLESYIKPESKPKFGNDGLPTSEFYQRNLEELDLEALLKPEEDVKKKFINVLHQSGISKNSAEKNYKKYAFSMFHNEDEDENKKFALLCQHKNLIHYDDHTPTLSLGTVVRSSKGENKYFVCIQQRCDSVRISRTDSRRFLFLSLTTVDGSGKFNFLTPDGKKLKLDRSTYDIRTVKFYGSEEGFVKVVKDGTTGELFFEPLHYTNLEDVSEKFEFVFELKDLYAQRVVSDYSASLARVGIDEPDWVRLS